MRHADRVYAVLMALLGATLAVRYLRDHGPDGAGRTVAYAVLALVLVGGAVVVARRSRQ